MARTHEYIRTVDPLPVDWRSFAWSSGTFDSARRAYTRHVEGFISLPHHLVLSTISGGARRLEVTAECGHRYDGEDFSGAISFVPAGCGRRFKMSDVHAEWASMSLRPDLLDDALDGRALEVPAFTNLRDPFISALIGEFVRLRVPGQRPAAAYCEAMTTALAQHLIARYGSAGLARARADRRRPLWRVRRVTDYVEAHFATNIQVADLARVAGLSTGHFHRALRATLGMTPLEFVNRRRIEQARRQLACGSTPIAEPSLQVGFESPSHFSRLFRRLTGSSPSEYRCGVRSHTARP